MSEVTLAKTKTAFTGRRRPLFWSAALFCGVFSFGILPQALPNENPKDGSTPKARSKEKSAPAAAKPDAQAAPDSFVPEDAFRSAAEVLKGVRESQGEIRQKLQGKLRFGPRKLPYRMIMSGADLSFEFPDAQPPDPQVVNLHFGEKDSTVRVANSSGTAKAAEFGDTIAGMPITYEDLAMRFLYWSDAQFVGEERLMPPIYLRCWKIRVRRPAKVKSAYREMLVWVSADTGAILKTEAYADDGQLVRSLKVISIQSSAEGTTLKQMRIESPLAGSSPVYLDVDGGPTVKAPR